MTPEEKHLLEQTYKLAEENNVMLRSIRRTSRISIIFRTLYWIVIIGTAIGAFYFIQPYIDSLTNIYGDIREGITGVKAAADTVNGIVR